jgi:hypothetical protein
MKSRVTCSIILVIIVYSGFPVPINKLSMMEQNIWNIFQIIKFWIIGPTNSNWLPAITAISDDPINSIPSIKPEITADQWKNCWILLYVSLYLPFWYDSEITAAIPLNWKVMTIWENISPMVNNPKIVE